MERGGKVDRQNLKKMVPSEHADGRYGGVTRVSTIHDTQVSGRTIGSSSSLSSLSEYQTPGRCFVM